MFGPLAPQVAGGRLLALLLAVLVPLQGAMGLLDRLAGPRHFHAAPVAATAGLATRALFHEHAHANRHAQGSTAALPLTATSPPSAAHSHNDIRRHSHHDHEVGVQLQLDLVADAVPSPTGEGKRAPLSFDTVAAPWAFAAPATQAPWVRPASRWVFPALSGERLERPPR